MRRKNMYLGMAAMLAVAMTGCTTTDTATTTASETTDAGTTEATTEAKADAEQTEKDDSKSETTVVGQVTAIDGTKVTVTPGEINEMTVPDDIQTGDSDSLVIVDDSAEAESGDIAQPGAQPGGQMPDGGSAPEKPDGSSSSEGEQPSMPEGEQPSMPDGEQQGAPDGEQLSMPEGEQPSMADGEQPSMPEGEQPGMPDGQTMDGNFDPSQMEDMDFSDYVAFTAGSEEDVTYDLDGVAIEDEDGNEVELSDIETGDVLTIATEGDTVVSVTWNGHGISMGGDQPGGQGGQGGQSGFGGDTEVTQGSAANEITEDGTVTGETYTSTGDDENALRVTGATVTLDGVTVDKSAGATSNTENGDFYGVNAALLATDGATVTITDATVTSSAQNGNGVFSYGTGTTVNISDSNITTTADNSGGIQTTGGGTTNATNLTVETSGNSSAAIRSDRGGGTVNVDQGTYTSNGYNSPAVYSTADITVSNAQLTANNSEALVIEGQNSITLTDCDVYGNMSDTEGTSSDENVHNVMIYQSMSGDAESGLSEFYMTGGSLTSANGDMFYITNTASTIVLSGVTVDNQDADSNLFTITGNSASHGWGTAGSNGAQADVTLENEAIEGDIVVDSISTLDLKLTDGTVFTGTVNIVDNEEGGTAVDDNAVITIDEGCTWKLTGDCTITSLTNNGTIDYNGYTITLADGTVLSE